MTTDLSERIKYLRHLKIALYHKGGSRVPDDQLVMYAQRLQSWPVRELKYAVRRMVDSEDHFPSLSRVLTFMPPKVHPSISQPMPSPTQRKYGLEVVQIIQEQLRPGGLWDDYFDAIIELTKTYLREYPNESNWKGMLDDLQRARDRHAGQRVKGGPITHGIRDRVAVSTHKASPSLTDDGVERLRRLAREAKAREREGDA